MYGCAINVMWITYLCSLWWSD